MTFFSLFSKPKNPNYHPIVLLVLDGWGIAPPSEGNAIQRAKKPYYEHIIANYPNGQLIASGEAVGLPANEVGNTEVGHLTIGAGRVILQDLKRINASIADGSFLGNPEFLKAVQHTRTFKTNLHIMGIVGSGKVHASIEHFYALLSLCREQGCKNVYLHLFTDGRDSPPQEAGTLIDEIEAKMHENGVGKIVSISGRYFAMDRDRRWDRTEKAYKAIVEGIGKQAQSAKEAIQNAYNEGVTDEFIEPTVILDNGKPVTVNDGDAVIFYNFRIDRPRQLTMALTLADFETRKKFEFGYVSDTEKNEGEVSLGRTFQRGKILKNICMITMTQYQVDIPVSGVAFPEITVPDPLGYILSVNKKRQVHMSESEKERFVTYYFNGMKEKSFEGEDVDITPSPKVATYDKRPQMSVFSLTKAVKRRLEKEMYDFVVVNFANADMVGHSGNVNATIKAIEYLDKAIQELTEAVLSYNGILMITADHGNAEELLTYPAGGYFFTTAKGDKNTDHSNNPVPICFIANQWKGKKTPINQGALSDIAPTILSLFNIKKPEDMTGRDLLEGTDLKLLS
jgi:2,3-bisphosphoglycerate-independent phosphoglycerate mutase